MSASQIVVTTVENTVAVNVDETLVTVTLAEGMSASTVQALLETQAGADANFAIAMAVAL